MKIFLNHVNEGTSKASLISVTEDLNSSGLLKSYLLSMDTKMKKYQSTLSHMLIVVRKQVSRAIYKSQFPSQEINRWQH